jgi:hypothetical protein
VITVCIFAKPPVAGQVKTRLAATIGAEQAARLAAAFLADTWESVQRLPWARGVIASTGELGGELVPGASVWPQGEGTLDARLERVLRRAVIDGPAIAIGADSPGLPVELLAAARDRLMRGEPVIGPAEDGGFYLLGVPTFPPGLLAGVPWSASDTCEATISRMTAQGLAPTLLPAWFDVDDEDDLPRLRDLLATAPERAPRTAAVLERMR